MVAALVLAAVAALALVFLFTGDGNIDATPTAGIETPATPDVDINVPKPDVDVNVPAKD